MPESRIWWCRCDIGYEVWLCAENTSLWGFGIDKGWENSFTWCGALLRKHQEESVIGDDYEMVC